MANNGIVTKGTAPKRNANSRPKPTGEGKPSDKPFVFPSAKGFEITFPPLSFQDIEVDAIVDLTDAMEGSELQQVKAVRNLLVSILPEEEGPKVGKLTIGELRQIIPAWQAHGGVSLGESAAS